MAGNGTRGSISRRTFAGTASALVTSLLAVRALGQASGAAQSSSPSASSAAVSSADASGAGASSSASSSDSTSLATQTDVNRLTTQVFINGKGPFKFIVDTGAERSVLSDTLVAQLGLTPTGKANVQGLILRVPTDLVTIDELKYGKFTKQGLVVPVLNRAELGADGCLGLDIINGTKVTFDFKNQAIRIQKSGMPVTADWGTTVVVVHGTGKGGRLRSNQCTVDSVDATAFIDTGSEATIGNMSLLRAMSAADHPNLGKALLSGATGGEASGRLTPVKMIQIQGLIFENGTIVVSDVPDFDQWGTSAKPAILIGMDFLRKFASITIDYRRKEITFELAKVQLDKRPPKVIVT